uniref:Uncharacterized protein n=1 Tax=Anguilla anguilla TaxID=7936 RepID=A0A0E9W238_ANGAN
MLHCSWRSCGSKVASKLPSCIRMRLRSLACVYCRNTPVFPWAWSTCSQLNA